MNWSIRYAAEEPSSLPEGLTEDGSSALKTLGALLNKKHIKYNQRLTYNEKYTSPSDEGGGWSTPVEVEKGSIEERQGNTHTCIRPTKINLELGKSKEPGDSVWQRIARGGADYPLEPTPETADAHEEMKKGVDTYGSPKEGGGWEMPKPMHPAVSEVLNTIKQEVMEPSGGSDLLQHTIANAPKENVPELHRGVSFLLPTDQSPGHQTLIPGLQKGAENIEANHQAILDHFKPGATIEEGIKSWSANPDIAKAFAYRGGQSQERGGSIQAIFHLPEKSSSLQISSLNPSSAFQEEYLHSGTSLEVTKHTVDEDGVHHIHLKEQSPVTGVNEEANKIQTPESGEAAQPKVEKSPEVPTSVRENTGAGLLLGRPTIPQAAPALRGARKLANKITNWAYRYAAGKSWPHPLDAAWDDRLWDKTQEGANGGGVYTYRGFGELPDYRTTINHWVFTRPDGTERHEAVVNFVFPGLRFNTVHGVDGRTLPELKQHAENMFKSTSEARPELTESLRKYWGQ